MQVQTRRYVRVIASMLASATLAVHGIAAIAQDSQPASAPNALVIGAVMTADARVASIDADTNSVVLRGPRGNLFDVQVNPDVGDVRKLRVGDTVHIAYKGAVLLSADKVNSNGIRSRIETDATTPASGGASATVRHVQVVATVQKIDRKNREVTLRGPVRTLTLGVAPDVPLDNLKVGDSIQADYVGAAAVQITRNGAALQ
jgi:Cu/Ag efflux protein CusF